MKISKIIGLASTVLALYFNDKYNEQKLKDLEKEKEKEKEKEREQHEAYVAEVLKENEKLQEMVNPNSGSHQSPVVFTATVTAGGQTLNQNEIVLNCTNTSSVQVEIGDFLCNIWIAGIKSLKIMPGNIGSVKIPAKSTVSFRLYARDQISIQSWESVKKTLNLMYDGKSKTVMRANTYIPADKKPILLTMQYLWYFKSGQEECFVYDIPGSYRWKSAGWTATPKVGYNAANENHRKKNPSYWDEK